MWMMSVSSGGLRNETIEINANPTCNGWQPMFGRQEDERRRIVTRGSQSQGGQWQGGQSQGGQSQGGQS
jgi:hypothetical protein